MGLIDFPDPVGIFESAKNAGLERQAANSLVSAAYSTWITFMWTSGSSKWALWAGEGKAMQQAAISAYLTLSSLETKGFLTLTVPKELLEADGLAQFQTEHVEK